VGTLGEVPTSPDADPDGFVSAGQIAVGVAVEAAQPAVLENGTHVRIGGRLITAEPSRGVTVVPLAPPQYTQLASPTQEPQELYWQIGVGAGGTPFGGSEDDGVVEVGPVELDEGGATVASTLTQRLLTQANVGVTRAWQAISGQTNLLAPQ